MTKGAMKKDIIGSGVFFCVFLCAFLMVGSLPGEAKMWPQFVCAMGMICCVILIAKTMFAMKDLPEDTVQTITASKDIMIRGLGVVLIVAVWILAMDHVGFIVTSSAAILALMCVPGKPETTRKMVEYLILSVAFSIVMWLVFGMLLGAKLPAGFLI